MKNKTPPTSRIAALAFFFIASALLALFHGAGVGFFLYEDLAFFDILTHFLGGMTVGAGLLWFFLVLTDTLPTQVGPGVLVKARAFLRQHTFFVILTGVLIVAVLWEVFELWAGIPAGIGNYALDTIVDIIMGVLGGITTLIFLKKYL